jgi:hypothetical protein
MQHHIRKNRYGSSRRREYLGGGTLFLSSGLSFLRMSGLLPFPLFPFHPSKYKRLGEVGYGVHSPSWWLVTVVGMDPDWMFFDHEVDP